MAIEALDKDADPSDTFPAPSVLNSLISVLAFEDLSFRIHAVKMLEHVFSPGRETLQFHCDMNEI